MSKPAVFALVQNETQARSAVLALESAGFIPTDISVLSTAADYDINGVEQPGFAKTREVGHVNATKAPEGATAGAAAGGAVGGLAGFLVAIGAMSIPGLGPFVAAGPLMSALSGAAVGGAAGGMAGALIGYGIPEYEARLFAGRIESGHILIGVHTVDDKEAESAKQALEKVGAEEIKVACEVGAV